MRSHLLGWRRARGRLSWALCGTPALLSLVLACSDVGRQSATSSGSDLWVPWEGQRKLAVDLRLGTLGGNLVFGSVEEVLPGPRGGVIVADAMGPAVTHFGEHGDVVTRFGRAGEGPGEYTAIAGVVALPDGRLVVRDVRRAIMVFAPGGDLLEEIPMLWPLTGPRSLFVDADGSLLGRIQVGQAPSAFAAPRYAFVAIAGGQADGDTALAPPPSENLTNGVVEFTPSEMVLWLPDRLMLVANSATYTLRWVLPNGAVAREVRHPYVPVALSDDEYEAYLRLWHFRRNRGLRDPGSLPALPRVKPAFRDVVVSRTGEVWVQRYGPGERVATQVESEPWKVPWRDRVTLLDVFGADGSYMGAAAGPPGFSIRFASGDTIWGVQEGDYDEQYVVRLVVSQDRPPRQ